MNKSKKCGIICAMKEEAEMITQAFDLTQKEEEMFPVFANEQVVLIESKIGKVASALAARLLFEQFAPERIINIGLAGALNPDFSPAQVFFVSQVCQHDAYMPIPEYKQDMYQKIAGHIPPGYNLPIVKLTSGDQFIDDQERLKKLSQRADLVDMEGFAVAYVAQKHGQKVTFIKAISDKADGSSQEDLFTNLQKAMQNSIKVLQKIVL